MNGQILILRPTIRFRKWSRKPYAVFCSIGRHITIGRTCKSIADASLATIRRRMAGACIPIPGLVRTGCHVAFPPPGRPDAFPLRGGGGRTLRAAYALPAARQLAGTAAPCLRAAGRRAPETLLPARPDSPSTGRNEPLKSIPSCRFIPLQP